MKTIKVTSWNEVSDNYTGIVEHVNCIKHWCLNGELHRIDGPAVETADGDKYWYLYGKRISQEDHYKRTAWTRTSVGKLMLKRAVL